VLLTQIFGSLPVNIEPMMGYNNRTWEAVKAEEEDEARDGVDVFMPPHVMAASLAQNEGLISASLMAGSMRRDKLKARTAILKQTGFLEARGFEEDSSSRRGSIDVSGTADARSKQQGGTIGGISQAYQKGDGF
jgi:hypothetical protein